MCTVSTLRRTREDIGQRGRVDAAEDIVDALLSGRLGRVVGIEALIAARTVAAGGAAVVGRNVDPSVVREEDAGGLRPPGGRPLRSTWIQA